MTAITHRLLLSLVLVAACLGVFPREAVSDGLCGSFFVYPTTGTVTAANLNGNIAQASTTNSTPQCVQGDSSSLTQMQATVDPFPSSVESLATSLEGELQRLRFVIQKATGWTQWYKYTTGSNFAVTSFGAKCDGSTDDTTSIQNALDQAALLGGIVSLPAGTCVIKATLTYASAFNLHLMGAVASSTSKGTTLTWNGNATTPAILFTGVRDSIIENFSIKSSTAFPLLTGIRFETITTRVSTRNTIRNINMFGTTKNDGSLGKGIQLAAGPSGTDANNDSFTFSHVTVVNTSTACFSFEGAQSMAHNFFNCQCQQGFDGVATFLGPATVGGSFRWFGGLMTGLTDADFHFGSPAVDQVLISGYHSETGARLMIVEGSATNPMPVMITGSNFGTHSPQFASDLKMIKWTGPGPLVLIGNVFGGGGAAPIPTVDLTVAGSVSMNLTMVGNHFASTSSLTTNPVTTNGGGTYHINRSNNLYTASNNNPTARTDETQGSLSGTYALNLAAPAVPGCTDSAAQTLTGVVLGDTVSAGIDVAPQSSQQITAFVNAADQVTFRVCQFAGGAVDPDGGGANYRADVVSH